MKNLCQIKFLYRNFNFHIMDNGALLEISTIQGGYDE